MSWPDSNRKRITYLLILPLILPLWITLPDTRRASSKKYFAVTFIGSILWIAVFSYLMVWWATITGEAFSIPPEVRILRHSTPKWIWIKSSFPSKWPSEPQSRPSKGSKSLEIKILHGRIFFRSIFSCPHQDSNQ